ncbi:phosphotransferase [Paenibacillus sp. FSL R7-0345]|uniref:phosphotransferase enzyme family protein n=1 Tax=Paenibacillus sp. FSL R7-0345 TaxID=2954535 RepID=UPI00315A7F55
MNEQEQSVLQALNALYPLELQAAEAVTGEMYRCLADNKVYFARVSDYKPYEAQAEEVKLLVYLRGAGVHVAEIIPSVSGKLIESHNLADPVQIVMFAAAPGAHLPLKEWDGEVFKMLGRVIGRLHKAGERYEQQHGRAEQIKDWTENREYQFLQSIPPEETLIRAAAQEVLQKLQAISRDGENYGIIHGDIWLENVLAWGETLTLIDFQDCERHYYLYDLAVPLYSALEFSFAGQGNIRDYGQRLAESLLTGYLEEHTLTSEMLGHLPLLLQLKELFVYNLMHLYFNKKELSEEQIRILNLYRMRIEHGIPAVQLDYERLQRLVEEHSRTGNTGGGQHEHLRL